MRGVSNKHCLLTFFISAENECSVAQAAACDANSDCAIIDGSPVCICRSGYEQDTSDPTLCNGKCFVRSIKVLTYTTVQAAIQSFI